MELLCNLVWVAVTAALWSSWLVRRRHAKTASILPTIALQLVSLAALTAILLPVISITDDLQAANNPAEVERSAGKRDHLIAFQQANHGTPGIVALVVPCRCPSLLTRYSLLSADFAVPAQDTAHSFTQWSRPPPAA